MKEDKLKTPLHHSIENNVHLLEQQHFECDELIVKEPHKWITNSLKSVPAAG